MKTLELIVRIDDEDARRIESRGVIQMDMVRGIEVIPEDDIADGIPVKLLSVRLVE